LIVTSLKDLLAVLADLIEREADQVCIGFTHLQAAAPTTVGYRLAGYAQDLLAAWSALRRLRADVRGKGFKGAVGTAATFRELLTGASITPEQMEADAMADLGLDAFLVTGQTYPRRQDWLVLSGLADVGMAVYRFAFDLRFLQSPPVGEWSEPFGAAQVGSSAMPFKRNPVNAENIDSLARYLSALPHIAWENAATSLLERTLDDSANRRIILPQAFLATDEIVQRTLRILKGLQLDRVAIKRNLAVFGTFAATERLLMEAVRMGGNRQTLHEIIRAHSLEAWEALREGSSNPLVEILSADERITRFVSPSRLRELMRAEEFVGTAPARARWMAEQMRATLGAGG
ncbi:MAG: adenylosuccinate lyase, partial [Anaerolineae bacterium]|nr:adenylosuccinate lyase [Anaerolineae bacterium]